MLLALAPSLEPDDIKSTSMGAGGEDVQLSPAARAVYPIQIECKNLAKIAPSILYVVRAYAGANNLANPVMETVMVLFLVSALFNLR